MSDEIRIVVNAALEHCLNLCKSVTEAKDAEIARLKAQRDRLAIDHRTILSARMPTGFADTALAERFGLRIVGGQVEEIGE